MPGTIQATVLEFKSGSSSSQRSAEYVKVSMGKRHYQTQDKGDFSFPITKLGEDLVLALVDARGNEMARADIRLVQIIEKGFWDEVFSLDGDGHVHMKLQVILNEEDRNRIRVMRESAMKKKQETDPTINLRLPESDTRETSLHIEKFSDSQKKVVAVDVVAPTVDAFQVGPSLNSATSSTDSMITYQKIEGSICGNAIPVKEFKVLWMLQIQVKTESPRVYERIPDEKIKIQSPIANIRSDIQQGALAIQLRSAISNKDISVAPSSQDDLARKSHNQSPLKITPSNVKKMISAFEKSPLQELKSLRKSSSVPSHLNRAGKGGLLELRDSKVSTKLVEQSSKKYKDQFATGDLHQTTSRVTQKPDIVSTTSSVIHRPNIIPIKTEQSQAPKYSDSNVEANLSSGKVSHNEEHSSRKYNARFVTGNLHQTTSSVTQRPNIDPIKSEQNQAPKDSDSYVEPSPASGEEPHNEDSSRAALSETMSKEQQRSPIVLVKKSSLQTSRSMYEEQNRLVQANNSSTERLDSLVTEERETNVKSSCEEKVPAGSDILEKHDLKQGTSFEMERDHKKFAIPPESGSGTPPHDSPNRLVGQVVKIAVILGFGVLVLFTRQKEPRKKSREGNVDIFTLPDYFEGTITD